MPRFLVVSIAASIVLTVVVNVALRISPGAGQWAEQAMKRATERMERPAAESGGPRVRVVFPWKLMVIGSLVLTLVLNLLLRLLR